MEQEAGTLQPDPALNWFSAQGSAGLPESQAVWRPGIGITTVLILVLHEQHKSQKLISVGMKVMTRKRKMPPKRNMITRLQKTVTHTSKSAKLYL